MTSRIRAAILLATFAAGATSPASARRTPPAFHQRPRDRVTCNMSNVGTFDPDPYGNNVVGSSYTGVLAGFGNAACDYADAIANGGFNTIAGNGFAADSFIGSGENNVIDNSTGSFSPNSFIGSGESDVVSVGNSAVASGASANVSAGQAFDGAGQSNSVGGGYSAILAGRTNATTGYTSFAGAGYHNSAGGDGAVVAGGGFQSSSTAAVSANLASGEDAFSGSGDGLTASGLQSFAGGGVNNSASGGDAVVGGGDQNAASSAYAFAGAGLRNIAAAHVTFVGAGYANDAGATGSFVGAGGSLYFGGTNGPNTILAPGVDAFVGAGDGNRVGTPASFIGGGRQNAISASTLLSKTGNAAFGAIAGGYSNSIASSAFGNAAYAFIGGGSTNSVRAAYAAIGGGQEDVASGSYGTVPGGRLDGANGTGSFAAGIGSLAASTGSFVWSDDATGAKTLTSPVDNVFLVRASGGVAFYSNPVLTSGVSLAAGSGTWASLSDRTMKTNLVALDDAAILEKVAALPVTEWSYRTEAADVRHVGPMAQDFYATFRVGEDDRHITSIDEAGVALAAIKALQVESRRAAVQTQDVAWRLSRLQAWDDARFAALERRLARLAAKR